MDSEAADGSGPTPLVSVLIVARNTGAYINRAIVTARLQRLRNIEILVFDDRSTDDTRAIAERHAALDARVRVFDGPGAGLAAIRNASLSAARGHWAAILDSDDMLHPEHIGGLVDAAQRTGAEIVAANMVEFDVTEGIRRSALFARRPGWTEERAITQAHYIRANGVFVDDVHTGYLKPLFDLRFFRQHALAYDDRLCVGEDYDLVARAMEQGARYIFVPRPTYFYRRHPQSTSHRITIRDLEALVDADRVGIADTVPPEVAAALRARSRSLHASLAHGRAVEALKARQPLSAVRHIVTGSGALTLLMRSVREALTRRLKRKSGRVGVADEPRPLLIGTPVEGGVVAAEVERLVHVGTPPVRRAVPGRGEEAGLSDGLAEPTSILCGEGVDEAVAAFALAPDVPVLTDPPLTQSRC